MCTCRTFEGFPDCTFATSCFTTFNATSIHSSFELFAKRPKETVILWCQVSFALLQRFFVIICSFIFLGAFRSWNELYISEHFLLYHRHFNWQQEQKLKFLKLISYEKCWEKINMRKDTLVVSVAKPSWVPPLIWPSVIDKESISRYQTYRYTTAVRMKFWTYLMYLTKTSHLELPSERVEEN